MEHGFVSFRDYQGRDQVGVFHPSERDSASYVGDLWKSPGDRLPVFTFDMKGMQSVEPQPLEGLAIDGETVPVSSDLSRSFELGFIGLTVDRPENFWCGGKVVAHLRLCSKRFGRFETTFAYVSRDDDGTLQIAIPA